ncbi:hypothetical protein CC80DRAFT_525646 [Byssothecium circinans]|uniref:Zn(2)-C6 fungal-type domain-containing protein n=1 Tax=Byssothecium circinans TaxID=147558 RepID=A0A6A5TWK7_9PLEO|nr:hypothetical protein CC80DRAFT_525646 [Byssothecium circinans]
MSESPDDGFFNDPRQNTDTNETRQSPYSANGQTAPGDDGAGKTKRIACVLCRKRKLRCDGARPTCSTCKRLSHDCAYDEKRKKSGPKRGYVKLLEARLQQVETLLKNQDSTDTANDSARPDSTTAYVANTLQAPLPNSGDFVATSERNPINISPAPDGLPNNGARGNAAEGDFPWEMIGLGLDEPLPPQDVMDELYQIYFTKVHPAFPIIHKPRFMAAMNLAPHMRPPVGLRYIMWTLAASITDKYDALQEHFYQRARKYAQSDEMKGHGESTITLAHSQMWVLTAVYEFRLMYFPRAWLSSGRATRLSQMMQLHRLDGVGLDVKQCLPPPKDWTEREERRRTFWMVFCIDRYASIGTGWPMSIDERDIMTNLPASEDAFDKSKPMPTSSLDQSLTASGLGNLQSFGGIVLTAALLGRNLLHLHRPGPDDHDDDLNGGFWKRHRSIENLLLQIALGLPDHLRVPSGLQDPNVVFLNMSIHTSVICLHQAAIFKADKHRLPINVSNESKIRCVTAGAEIASLMRMISHMDLATMNPFISFCVYVAARVFVQYLKSRPKDQQMNSSLQFLLQAMQALRRKNPLTESFLVQLDLDLESAGIPGLRKPYIPACSGPATSIPVNTDAVGCSPLFEIRDSQNPNAPMNQFKPLESLHAPQNRTPGPPFHLSSVNDVNLDTSQNSQFMTSQTAGNEMNPPSNPFNLGDGNQMDMSPEGNADMPSPATSNSRTHSQSGGGSTSHSSYSPGQHTEHIPYRPSPRMSNQVPLARQQMPVQAQPSPSTSTANMNSNINANTTFFTANEDMFASMYGGAGTMGGGDGLGNGFVMNNDWDMGVGIGVGGAPGMTPMSEGTWNQMLESINMDWNGMGTGTPHGADSTNR